MSVPRRLETRRLNSRGGDTLFGGRYSVTRSDPFSTVNVCTVNQSFCSHFKGCDRLKDKEGNLENEVLCDRVKASSTENREI